MIRNEPANGTSGLTFPDVNGISRLFDSEARTNVVVREIMPALQCIVILLSHEHSGSWMKVEKRLPDYWSAGGAREAAVRGLLSAKSADGSDSVSGVDRSRATGVRSAKIANGYSTIRFCPGCGEYDRISTVRDFA